MVQIGDDWRRRFSVTTEWETPGGAGHPRVAITTIDFGWSDGFACIQRLHDPTESDGAIRLHAGQNLLPLLKRLSRGLDVNPLSCLEGVEPHWGGRHRAIFRRAAKVDGLPAFALARPEGRKQPGESDEEFAIALAGPACRRIKALTEELERALNPDALHPFFVEDAERAGRALGPAGGKV